MKQSETINELATALSKAQAEIGFAVKDSKNTFFKSNYADLAAVWSAAKPALAKHGLSIAQPTEIREGSVVLLTTLMHSSGQFIQGDYPIHPVKNDPQALGSAIKYARRYALAAMLNIPEADDDGEAAMGRGKANELDEKISAPAPVQSEYVIPFGKHNGKTLKDLGAQTVANYVSWVEDQASKQKKPIEGQMKELVERAKEFLSAEVSA